METLLSAALVVVWLLIASALVIIAYAILMVAHIASALHLSNGAPKKARVASKPMGDEPSAVEIKYAQEQEDALNQVLGYHPKMGDTV